LPSYLTKPGLCLVELHLWKVNVTSSVERRQDSGTKRTVSTRDSVQKLVFSQESQPGTHTNTRNRKRNRPR